MRTGPSLPRRGTSVGSCPPPGSVLTVNSVLCPGSLRGHEGMCEKVLCQVSIREAVVFPPVLLLQGSPSPRGPLPGCHHHSPVGFPCLHRHPVYTDPEAVCSDRPHALVSMVRATTPGARGGPMARLLSPRSTSPTLLIRSLLGASAMSRAEGLTALPAAPPGLFVL